MRKLLGILAVALCTASAQAVLPFSTGFEAPDYATGPLSGQQGWIEINGGTGAPTTNMDVVNNAANAFAGDQYVETNTGTWGAFASNTSRFAWVDNPYSGNTPVDASLRVNVINNFGNTITTGGGLFLFGTNVAPGDSLIAGMRLLTNGQLQLFNGAGAGIGFNPNALFPLGAYNEMRMVANLQLGWIDYYVNGTHLNPFLGTFATTFTAGIGFNDADLYAVRGTSGTGGGTVRFDNMNVTPEPASVALLALGGLVLVRRRK